MIDNNEDEDDYEGYFLRPANEYNIKEKIKIANQESFAIPTPPSPKYLAGERRVTFREQLVDYEPDEYSGAEDEDGFRLLPNGTTHNGSESSPEVNDRSQSKSTNGNMDEVDEDIIEELSINEPNEDDIQSRVETVQDDEEQEDEEEEEEEEREQDDDEELDEEVTESSLDTEIHNPETTSEDSSSPTKARTSEEGSGSGDGPEINYSEDSQNDDDNSEERQILKERLMRESLSYDNEGLDDEEHTLEQQEDENDDDDESDGRDSPVQEHLRKRSDKCKRKCCRFKKVFNEKLPYYNGYHSEYGLSKAELDAKQKRVEAKKKRFHERYQKKVEEQQVKAQTNEEAFASWLNKKLKNSINKYQNMYDLRGKKHKKRLSKEANAAVTAN